MRVARSTGTNRKLIAVLALAGFALRALVPVGFMPVPGRLFSLELCPDGLPSAMLPAGMHHDSMAVSGSHSEQAGNTSAGDEDEEGGPPPDTHPAHIEHCAFGCASTLALVAHAPAADLLLATYLLPAARFTPQRTGWLLLRIPLPRGPPALA